MASNLVQFYGKVNRQQDRLRTKYFVNIYSSLQKGITPSIDFEKLDGFEAAIPVDFHEFLADCTNLLLTNEIEVTNFSRIGLEYFITLIYFGLSSADSPVELESAPLQAANLLFMLMTEKYARAVKLTDLVLKAMAAKVISVLEERAKEQQKISATFVHNWANCLKTSKRHFHLDGMVRILAVLLREDCTTIFKSFKEDDPDNWTVTSKSIYMFFKSMINDAGQGETKKVVATVASYLAQQSDNEILDQNLHNFFRYVLHQFCNETWYISLLALLIKNLKDKVTLTRIMNLLPTDRYYKAIHQCINNFVKLEDEPDTKRHLTFLNCVLVYPYQPTPDDRRLEVVKRILNEAFYRCSSVSYPNRQCVMEFFICWCQMKDLSVRRQLQQMFRIPNRNQIAKFFELALEGVDITWKTSEYNATFIIFACRMLMTHASFVTAARIRVLEILCYKSSLDSLQICMPAILDLIRYYGATPHPVVKALLSVLIHNALSGATHSIFYMQALFDLLANAFDPMEDGTLEFAVCDTVISDDLPCLELFKMFQKHNLIRREHIDVLLREKILKHPCSWKLLTVLLENMECGEFPGHIANYLQRIRTCSYHEKPEFLYVLQVLTKIFAFKVKTNTVNSDDKELAESLVTYLIDTLKTMELPMKHVNATLILLNTISTIAIVDFSWTKRFCQERITYIMAYDIVADSGPLMRDIMYVEQLFLLLDTKLNDGQVQYILNMVKIRNQARLVRSNESFAAFLSFYGKICIKRPEHSSNAIPVLQHAMLHGTTTSKLIALATMYDVSNLALHDFGSLYRPLMTLLRSENFEIKYRALKIFIKLVNDNHIKMTCSDFIIMNLVLLEKNYKLSMSFVRVLETDFLHRNQHTVTKYFINFLFYLNKYLDHPTFQIPIENISVPRQDFTYARRTMVYLFLFRSLPRPNQLQILNALNEEFLIPFYNGRIESSSTVLCTLEDILTLVSLHAVEYMVEPKLDVEDAFYNTLFSNMKRDFFTRKRYFETSVMDFDKTIEKLLVSLLNVLYKVEKTNMGMFPQFFKTVAIMTRTFYSKVLRMVHENRRLKELYYQLENYYLKYKDMVIQETRNIIHQTEKEEWNHYVGSYVRS